MSYKGSKDGSNTVVIVMMMMMFMAVLFSVFSGVGLFIFLSKEPEEGDSCKPKRKRDKNAKYEIDYMGDCEVIGCKGDFKLYNEKCIIDKSGEDCDPEIEGTSNAIYGTNIIGECVFESCKTGYELSNGACITPDPAADADDDEETDDEETDDEETDDEEPAPAPAPPSSWGATTVPPNSVYILEGGYGAYEAGTSLELEPGYTMKSKNDKFSIVNDPRVQQIRFYNLQDGTFDILLEFDNYAEIPEDMQGGSPSNTSLVLMSDGHLNYSQSSLGYSRDPYAKYRLYLTELDNGQGMIAIHGEKDGIVDVIAIKS